MAINYNQWKGMNPDKDRIVDYIGENWEVVNKVEGGTFPAFILKTMRRASEEFCFAPTPDNGQTGILDKDEKLMLI